MNNENILLKEAQKRMYSIAWKNHSFNFDKEILKDIIQDALFVFLKEIRKPDFKFEHINWVISLTLKHSVYYGWHKEKINRENKKQYNYHWTDYPKISYNDGPWLLQKWEFEKALSSYINNSRHSETTIRECVELKSQGYSSKEIGNIINKKSTACEKIMLEIKKSLAYNGTDIRRKLKEGGIKYTNSINMKPSDKSSRYIGVTQRNRYGKNNYEVRFGYTENGTHKRLFLGVFKNEDDAGAAYNQKALEMDGDNAILNIIGEDNRELKKQIIKRKVMFFRKNVSLKYK